MIFCKQCGAQVEPNVRFCEKCFARLDGTNTVSTVNEYELAFSKRNSADFSPDAYVVHNDLSGETVNGFRLIEYLYEAAGSDFYNAASNESGVLEKRTVQHILIPEPQSYDVLMFMNGLDRRRADEALRKCVELVRDEIRSFMAVCDNARLPCVYKDCRLYYSENLNIYHVFIFMAPVMPLWRYIFTHPITLRRVVEWGISLCSQLMELERIGERYGAVDDANIYLDSSGGVFLGSRLPQVFSESMYLNAYSTVRSIYKKPESFPAGQDVYGTGMLLYILLNKMRHPYINQFRDEINMSEFLEAEKLRAGHLQTRLPVFSENSLGKTLLRTFSNVDEHIITLAELHRILSNSLNYITSEELNRVVLDLPQGQNKHT